MKKREYYKIANLLKTEAAYMILLGMRANGKSYAAKETVLRDAYENGVNFVYLRRWREDIKRASVEAYFADMPIEKITVGEYNTVIAWQGSLYFAVLTDEEIQHYVTHYRPMDKAGAYGIQEWIGYCGIESIEGSFYNVMGLPVQRLYRELECFIERLPSCY